MHCVDVAHALGSSSVAGPFYTETGRTWRISDSARQGLVTTSFATRSLLSWPTPKPRVCGSRWSL